MNQIGCTLKGVRVSALDDAYRGIENAQKAERQAVEDEQTRVWLIILKRLIPIHLKNNIQTLNRFIMWVKKDDATVVSWPLAQSHWNEDQTFVVFENGQIGLVEGSTTNEHGSARPLVRMVKIDDLPHHELWNLVVGVVQSTDSRGLGVDFHCYLGSHWNEKWAIERRAHQPALQ
jgi:hypothetical protein